MQFRRQNDKVTLIVCIWYVLVLVFIITSFSCNDKNQFAWKNNTWCPIEYTEDEYIGGDNETGEETEESEEEGQGDGQEEGEEETNACEIQGKVVICHNGNTLCISENAVDAHLAHPGDYLGECDGE